MAVPVGRHFASCCRRRCSSPVNIFKPLAASPQSPYSSALLSSVLRSSVISHSISTTTTSADSFPPSGLKVSSGKPNNSSPVPSGSTPCIFEGFRVSPLPASSPPALSLSASSCPYGRGCATRFFQFRLTAYTLRFASVTSFGSGRNFHPAGYLVCRAHWPRPSGLGVLGELPLAQSHDLRVEM